MANAMKGGAIALHDDDPRRPVRLGEFEAPSLGRLEIEHRHACPLPRLGLDGKVCGTWRWALGIGNVLDCEEIDRLRQAAPSTSSTGRPAHTMPSTAWAKRLDREIRQNVSLIWRTRAAGCSEEDRADLEQSTLTELATRHPAFFVAPPSRDMDAVVGRACKWAQQFARRRISELVGNETHPEGVHRRSRHGYSYGLQHMGRATAGGQQASEFGDAPLPRGRRKTGQPHRSGPDRARHLEDLRIRWLDVSRGPRLDLVDFWHGAGDEFAATKFRAETSVSPREFAGPLWATLVALAIGSMKPCPGTGARPLEPRQAFVAFVDARNWRWHDRACIGPGQLTHHAMTTLWISALGAGVVGRLESVRTTAHRAALAAGRTLTRDTGWYAASIAPVRPPTPGMTSEELFDREVDAVTKARRPTRRGIEYVTVVDGIDAAGTVRTHERRVRPGYSLVEAHALAVMPGRETDFLRELDRALAEFPGAAIISEVSSEPEVRSGLSAQRSPSAGA